MNLELNVVRFENEDVIATSCDANLSGLPLLYKFTQIEGSEVHYDYYKYNSDKNVFYMEEHNEINNFSYFTGRGINSSDIKVNNWVHCDANGKADVCKDPSAHKRVS